MTTILESMRTIERICSSFEDRGDLGPQSVLSRLNEIDVKDRTALATELIALDVELRLAAGESPAMEDYRSLLHDPEIDLTFPQLDSLIQQSLSSALNTSAEPPASKRYRFLQHIGSGAYGDVWRVEDSTSDRVLAVKVARNSNSGDPNASDRLTREALLTGKLQHPGVPPVYDHGELLGGEAFFAMKLVGGSTLESLLSKRTSVADDLQHTLAIFHSVTQTIAYAHAQGVIHRDLKPHNIMVGDFGEVQVMDWGMAKTIAESTDPSLLNTPAANESLSTATDNSQQTALHTPAPESCDSQTSLTTDGDVLGTPAYMSPEQARGEKSSLGTPSDVFSLGAILFQIVANKRLHDRRSPADAIRLTALGDLKDSLAELEKTPVNRELVELCRSCLAASAVARPDAKQLCRELSNYFSQTEKRARQAELDRREALVLQSESARRRRVLFISACAITLVSCLGTSIAFWQRSVAIASQQQAMEAQTLEAQARAIADRENETAEEVNDFLMDLLASARPEEQGVDVTVRQMLDSTLPELENRFKDKPKVEGLIRRAFGTTYRSLGMKDIALRQHRLAVEALKRVEPLDEDALLNAQDRLAGILRSRGKPEELEEARRLREHVLERTTQLFGEEDNRTILAMGNLAVVYSNLKDHEKAKKLMQRSIELEEASGESDPLSLDFARYNMATFAFDSKDYETAERVFLELLKQYRSDPEAIRLFLELHNVLAQLYEEQGRDEEALLHFRDALASRREELGELHDATLSSMRKLGRHLIAMKRFEEALPLLQEALSYHNQFFSAASSLTLDVRQNFARALAELNRREEAEEMLRETVAILVRDRGEDYPNTLKAQQHLDEFLDESAELSTETP